MLKVTPEVVAFLLKLPSVMSHPQAMQGVAGLLRLGAHLQQKADEEKALQAARHKNNAEIMSGGSGI